jgi:hypothetical protein
VEKAEAAPSQREMHGSNKQIVCWHTGVGVPAVRARGKAGAPRMRIRAQAAFDDTQKLSREINRDLPTVDRRRAVPYARRTILEPISLRPRCPSASAFRHPTGTGRGRAC